MKNVFVVIVLGFCLCFPSYGFAGLGDCETIDPVSPYTKEHKCKTFNVACIDDGEPGKCHTRDGAWKQWCYCKHDNSKKIKSAFSLLYPPSSVDIGVFPAAYLNIKLEMEDGDSLPGIVEAIFNVDSDPLIDIAITIFLRDQSAYAQTALCAECIDPTSCKRGRKRGDWYAETVTSGEDIVTGDWGRIEMPLPYETDTEVEDCYKLPWARIVENLYGASGANFNFTEATDPANTSYQISIFYDEDFSISGDDLLELNDTLPASGMFAVSTVSGGFPPGPYQEMCEGDFDGDGAVRGE